MARTLHIKGWRKFQHYTDRKPPWIKLYVDLLDDLAYLGLSDAAQAGLPRVWLLAARLGHPLPYDLAMIAGMASIKKRALMELIRQGWILEENASAGASKDSPEMLEKSSSLAGADTPSRQRSEVREQKLPLPGGISVRVREALPDLARDVFDQLGGTVPDGMARALLSAHEPISGGKGYPWDQIGQALVDYASRNHREFVPMLFKRFLENNARPPLERVHGVSTGSTRQERNFAAIDEGLRRANGLG